MKFGEISLADAEGAILVHALAGPGYAFRKGRVLARADLDRLAAAGVAQVTAVRLEADDVPEDQAAAALAGALAGEGLVAAAPFTGRANLLAAGRGLARVDAARIDAINAIDEAITVATLPRFAPVEPRQMVATIKIIPFAAPRAALDQALAIARDGGPALALAAFRPLRAALIQTRLPGTKPSVLAKTVEATRARVVAAGGALERDAIVEHDVAKLTDALREALAAGCSPVMVLGASAVTDRRDVIPAAIEAAGGKVEHFGMPVDPGNLLVLAHVGAAPVIGLPGCARSPKLNGFDWVLQRLAAGIDVTRADIVAMGVGGLLAEIPSRPQPRASDAAAMPRAPRIAAVVLAAGRSSRMAPANKLLTEVDGVPMVVRAVEAALASQAAPVIVVVGNDAARVRRALAGRDVTIVENPAYAEGLSTSLRAGIAALPAGIDGAVVLLGDMPRVAATHLDRLIAAFSPVEGRAICVPTFRAKRGNPVLWASSFFPEFAALAGDSGARALLGRHAEQIVEVEMPDDGILIDVDTPAALAELRGAATRERA